MPLSTLTAFAESAGRTAHTAHRLSKNPGEPRSGEASKQSAHGVSYFLLNRNRQIHINVNSAVNMESASRRERSNSVCIIA